MSLIYGLIRKNKILDDFLQNPDRITVKILLVNKELYFRILDVKIVEANAHIDLLTHDFSVLIASEF